MFLLTDAFAALHVRLQLPALIAGALDVGLLLLALLATLEVFGAEALDHTGLVVCSQLHPQWTGAHEALSWDDAAVVATPAIVQCTQVCREGTRGGGWGWGGSESAIASAHVRPREDARTAKLLVGAVWTVVGVVAQLLGGKTDGAVGRAHVVRQLAHQSLAVVLVGVVLAVAVTVTHPGLADAAC